MEVEFEENPCLSHLCDEERIDYYFIKYASDISKIKTHMSYIKEYHIKYFCNKSCDENNHDSKIAKKINKEFTIDMMLSSEIPEVMSKYRIGTGKYKVNYDVKFEIKRFVQSEDLIKDGCLTELCLEIKDQFIKERFLNIF